MTMNLYMQIKNPPQQLTVDEMVEFVLLKKLLFRSDKLVAFTDEQTNTEQFKRYDELLKKKMAHLEYATQLMRSKRFN